MMANFHMIYVYVFIVCYVLKYQCQQGYMHITAKVHGAGIQVVVIRVLKVVSQPAWNVATAAKCKRM